MDEYDERLERTYEAVLAAGGNVREVDRAVADQGYPHMVGRLRGFVVNLAPATPWDERFVRVWFTETGAEAVLRDSAPSPGADPDTQRAGRAAAKGWREIDGFMRGAGVALEATVGGMAASLALLDGGLAVREGTGARGPVRARIRFCDPPRSLLVEAECPPGGERVAALDWVRVERWLARRGVSVRPRVVEPVAGRVGTRDSGRRSSGADAASRRGAP